MGCDIHLYVERRDPDGSWKRVRCEAWMCPWCNGKGKSRTGAACHWCQGAGSTTKEYHERNYDLFAMLANVRNGSGFAGCDTGDGFAPLAEPRGLPADVSITDTEDEDYNNSDHSDRVWLGDHSFSYCSLAEVLAYDFDRTTKHRGVVNAAEYGAWVETGRKGPPKSYSGGVMGNFVRTVEQPEMDALIRSGRIKTTNVKGPFDSPKADDGVSYYTTVEWTSTYRESAGKAWFAFIEACKPLGAPEDIRFVFGFDS